MQVLREGFLVLVGGAALGLVANAVRADGLDLATVPSRAVEGACAPPTEEARWISQEQALRLVGRSEVMFIDARANDEFVQAHIAGAFSLPYRDGDPVGREELGALEGAATVIAYCDTQGGCTRSLALARRLSAAGQRDVRVLEGGWPAWLSHGYPAEAGECRLCPDQTAQ
ncbi:MAG: rhodanese-like domain-containing protein [Deltaproteobacteria bacterium]|nr:rhodanese-like domain-containing protein [Deltaproteobacteria bacterium]